MIKPPTVALALLSLLPLTSVSASEDNNVWLTVGGFSYHSSGDFNQVNPGLGVELPFNYSEGTTFSVGFYKNSYDRRSNYAAFNTSLVKSDHYSLGLSYGVVSGYGTWEKKYHYERNKNEYAYEYHDKWKAVVLPTLTLEYDNIGVNVMFIPKIEAKGTNALALQFKVKLK